MSKLTLFLLTIVVCSCDQARIQESKSTLVENIEGQTDILKEKITTADSGESLFEEASEYSDTETYFIVIADTSNNYFRLRQSMYSIHRNLNIPIDTMGRTYYESKDLIALPEDDEDEVYAGDYYHRRFPSTSLSLEYLNSYQDISGAKTIALVTGIYERKNSADSALAIIKQTSPKAFVVQTDMYIGCIH